MEKINVAELLKDCPKGMELDCTMYENVTFVRVDMSRKQFPIEIAISGIRSKYLTKEGCFHDITHSPESKCVIFPKGKTTWERFVPPRKFKDGDILTTNIGSIFIFSHLELDRISDRNICKAYVGIRNTMPISLFHTEETDIFGPYESLCKFATEEEKSKLFDAIKDNGYKWNSETKTLEKLVEPIFRIGDKITNGKTSITIGYIDNEYYYEISRNIATRLFIKYQDEWNLVPDKFDISALKPFDSRVLMRSSNAREWVATFYSHYSNNKFYGCGMCCDQCIPYEGNEHLLGKTDDCDEYFKTWK